MTLRFTGREEAIRAVEANKSIRYRALDQLEQYVETEQYAGRQSWWASGPDAKPLLERAPCIAYPIVASAIESNADLLLGEGRYPEIEAEAPFEDADADLPGDDGELPDDYDAIQRSIDDISKQVGFQGVAVEVFSAAQGCGTGVSIYGVRNRRLFVDTVKAKWCEPTFAVDGSVEKLDIRYPYCTHTRMPDGAYKVEAKLFRRVIDVKRDVTFLPADADKRGKEPAWKEDKKQSFAHGLGHCPVIWYAHMQGCSTVEQIDGRAIHEKALDEIEAHDFSVSQRHRAALMCGDPQWTEIGVDDSGPAAAGRHPSADAVLQTRSGGLPSQSNPIIGAINVSQPAPARKKGPGEVWKYPDKDVKVQMHSLPGGALTAIDDNASDLKLKVSESLAVVFLDPDQLKFAASLSGKAITMLKGRQLDRVDKYRTDFGEKWMVPQLQGLLRVVAIVGDGLRLRGAKRIQSAIVKIGGAPDLELHWGPYYKPTTDDEQKLVDLTIAAKDAGLITLKMCLEKLQTILGIADVEEVLAELEADKADREAQENDRLLAEHKAMAAFAKAPTGPPKPKAIADAKDAGGA